MKLVKNSEAARQTEDRGKTPKHGLQTVQKEPTGFGKSRDMNARADESSKVRSVSPKPGRKQPLRHLKENVGAAVESEDLHAKKLEERLRSEYQQLTSELIEYIVAESKCV